MVLWQPRQPPRGSCFPDWSPFWSVSCSSARVLSVMALHSQHPAGGLLVGSVACRRLPAESCLAAPSLPWSQDPTAPSRHRALSPSPAMFTCALAPWAPQAGRSLLHKLPLTADLLASCRSRGGLLSPLALVKWPPLLRPVPAAALPTAWAEFMTRIHQIRRTDTVLLLLCAECSRTTLQAPLPAEQAHVVMLGIF